MKSTFISSTELLELLLKKRELSNEQYVIIDIDDTIFDLSKRRETVYSILRKLYDLPEINTEAFRMFYNAKDLFMKYNIDGDRIDILNQEYLKLFFIERFLKTDQLFPGIKEFIGTLYARQFKIVLLTGRTSNTRNETIKAFKKFKFPIENANIDLVMKEDFNTPDLDFKLEYIQKLSKNKKVISFIDNDSEICNKMNEFFNGKSLIVRYNSVQKDDVIFNGLKLNKWS